MKIMDNQHNNVFSRTELNERLLGIKFIREGYNDHNYNETNKKRIKLIRRKIDIKTIDLNIIQVCRVCRIRKTLKKFLHVQDRKRRSDGIIVTDAHIKNICNNCLSRRLILISNMKYYDENHT